MDDLIHQNADRIAQILGSGRKASQLPGFLARNVKRLIQAASNRAPEEIYRALRELHRQIEPHWKRDYLLCWALIEHLWLLPSNSPATAEIIRLARETFQNCDQSSFRKRLRSEMATRQTSAFEAERRSVAKLLELTQVDDAEIKILSDRRTYWDVRSAIASRVLQHLQTEHIESLLRYCSQVASDPDAMPEETHSMRRVLAQLHDFELTDVLKPLFFTYLSEYEHKGVRGDFLKALSRFGEPLVAPLMQFYHLQTEGREREKILRILRQLMNHGSLEATRTLCDLARREFGAEFNGIATNLQRAFLDYVSRTPRNEQKQEVFDLVDALCRDLRPSDHVRHRNLVDELEKLRALDENQLRDSAERLVAGLNSEDDRWRLMRASYNGIDLLLAVIRDPSRPNIERIRATEFLVEIPTCGSHVDLGLQLWDTFRSNSTDELKIAVLRMLPRSRRRRQQDTREVLMNAHRDGSAALKKTITEYWNQLIPDAPSPLLATDGSKGNDTPL